MTDHDIETCSVARAYHAWRDMVAIQEEHSADVALVFAETQERAGWTDHQECITPVIDAATAEIMEARIPEEAMILIRSALCQVALICFIMGRQHEGAEV
jgi:hypothetical protein